MNDSLYIVIPAYNEEANLGRVLEDWYPIVEQLGGDSRLVIINDGSKDSTWSVLQAYAADHPLLVPLTKENGGHGSTVLHGYRYAIEHGAEYVFQTDSDGQTNPDEFAAFWAQRKEYDAIFGHRTHRGDGQSRAFVEKVVCMLVRLYFGVKVPDANAPFRLMRADVLKQYVEKLPTHYNLPNIMITTYFVHYKQRVAFKPISFKPRQAGKNTINIKRIVKIGWKALSDFRMLKKGMKK